jgi:hypothetical protein
MKNEFLIYTPRSKNLIYFIKIKTKTLSIFYIYKNNLNSNFKFKKVNFQYLSLFIIQIDLK